METGRDEMPRKWRGNGGEEDRNFDGDCIEIDLERVGEGCKKQKELETTCFHGKSLLCKALNKLHFKELCVRFQIYFVLITVIPYMRNVPNRNAQLLPFPLGLLN